MLTSYIAHPCKKTAYNGVAELSLNVSRKFHPNRLKSYTIWNMGSRVNFLLAAPGQKAPASGNSSCATPDKAWPIHSSLLLRITPGKRASQRRP